MMKHWFDQTGEHEYRIILSETMPDPWVEWPDEAKEEQERGEWQPGNWEIIDNPNFGKVREARKIPLPDGDVQIIEILDDRRRIMVRKEPPEKTLAQLADEKQTSAEKAFREEYPVSRELSILRAAVVSGDATEAKKMYARYLELGGAI